MLSSNCFNADMIFLVKLPEISFEGKLGLVVVIPIATFVNDHSSNESVSQIIPKIGLQIKVEYHLRSAEGQLDAEVDHF